MDMAQVYSDPHVLDREMLVEISDPELGVVKNIGIPVKLSKTPGRIRSRAPKLGEHTEEILAGAEYSEAEVLLPSLRLV